MRALHLIVLFPCLLPLEPLAAQVPPPVPGGAPQAPARDPQKEEPPSLLSFVILGAAPKRTFFIKGGNGGIEEASLKPGEAPPSRILCKAGKVVTESWLTLNVPSGVTRLEPGNGSVAMYEYQVPEGEDAQPQTGKLLVTVPVRFPGKSQTAFLLKKDPRKDWNQELGVISFTDDPAVFPVRSVRAVNLSGGELFVQIGEKKFQVPPGKSSVVPTPESAVPIIAAVRQGEGFFTAVRTSRLLRSNDRLTLVVYNFDGEKGADKPAPPVAGVLIAQPVQDG